MLSAHAHATRAVSATNRAAMVQAVERAETEAEAKVEAVREHVTVFTKEQMGVIDVLDAEVQKLETQVEASERARVEAGVVLVVLLWSPPPALVTPVDGSITWRICASQKSRLRVLSKLATKPVRPGSPAQQSAE